MISSELELENSTVLDVVQAMYGGVFPELRAVSLEMRGRLAVLHILTSTLTSEVKDGIADIEAEAEVLANPSGVEIDSVVSVGDSFAGWEGRRFRGIFAVSERANVDGV